MSCLCYTSTANRPRTSEAVRTSTGGRRGGRGMVYDEARGASNMIGSRCNTRKNVGHMSYGGVFAARAGRPAGKLQGNTIDRSHNRSERTRVEELNCTHARTLNRADIHDCTVNDRGGPSTDGSLIGMPRTHVRVRSCLAKCHACNIIVENISTARSAFRGE